MTTNYKNTAKEVEQSVAATADHLSDKLREGGTAAMRMAEDATGAARDVAGKVKDAAGEALATVRDAAVEKADVARESLSDVGERLAATLQSASADTGEDALKSRVLSSVAQGLTTASDALRQRSVADLTADVRTLARRHPGAFMAAAAVAGFAAARFVRSSSQRRLTRQDDSRGPRV